MHNAHAAAAELASVINGVVDLSPIEVSLHDEIFQGGPPLLAGVDAASTDCYLLEAVEHRDTDTWGVHLLEASAQGLDPKCTVADSGSGLRAGQQQAWPDTPCHGDVLHIQHQIEGVANTLARIVQGHTTRCKALQARIDKGHQRDRNATSSDNSSLPARLKPDHMRWRATCERSSPGWAATCWRRPVRFSPRGRRQAMFDFVVTDLQARENGDEHGDKHGDEQRIRAVRVALENQRDDLLAFAVVLDGEFERHRSSPRHTRDPRARGARAASLAEQTRPEAF